MGKEKPIPIPYKDKDGNRMSMAERTYFVDVPIQVTTYKQALIDNTGHIHVKGTAIDSRDMRETKTDFYNETFKRIYYKDEVIDENGNMRDKYYLRIIMEELVINVS